MSKTRELLEELYDAIIFPSIGGSRGKTLEKVRKYLADTNSEHERNRRVSELKPCPFCGGIPAARMEEGFWGVTCYNCMVKVEGDCSKDGAIQAWNTRHAEAKLQERITELETKLDEVLFADLFYDNEESGCLIIKRSDPGLKKRLEYLIKLSDTVQEVDDEYGSFSHRIPDFVKNLVDQSVEYESEIIKLQAEVKRLRKPVKEAYIEGNLDGCSGWAGTFEESKASKALTGRGPKMKTETVTIRNIKMSDGWCSLATNLKYEQFKKDNPDLEIEEELPDAFYARVISKMFEYGEFGTVEIEVDEEFNIVGGRIIPSGKTLAGQETDNVWYPGLARRPVF